MKTQRAFGQVVVLALLVAFGAAAGAATLFSASAQGDFIGAAEANSEGIDVVIVYDRSGSMEFDTLCYGCWEASEERYPSGYIYPLPWSDSTMEFADHCATSDRYYEQDGEIYVVIEAEEYSRLSADYHGWGYTPYYSFWVLQRNSYNDYWNSSVGAYGRDARGAYLSHHPFANYIDSSGLGVPCTWDDLNDGEYCRRGLPAGGPFPAPRADYDFYVPRDDDYYFHIRGQGGAFTHDRHVFWGVDGVVQGQESGFSGGPYYDGAASGSWSWHRLSKGEGGNQGDTVWLNSGDHTFHLWAGGAGFDVDRFIISTDSSLESSDRTLFPNNGRTGWACDPCDPRFAGRPGGHEWTADEPYYRPDCNVGGDPDKRDDAIYDDEQPMRNALEAAKRFVGRLDPRFDQVGYVPYSTDAEIASELQCLQRLGADSCTAEVITDTVLYGLECTRAGGSTNIAAGLESGIDVLSTTAPHYGRPGATRAMVLMTDGQANRYPNYPDYHECWQEDLWPDTGDSSIDRAADCVMYYAQVARDNDIAICTISLGESADRELMAAVAELGGCYHRGADSREELDAIFDELYEYLSLQLSAQKTASTGTTTHGQTVTYTIAVQSALGPLSASVHITDEVPAGLSYVPGTLTATGGTVTDTAAPTLRWTGLLTPTPAVTISYAVTVSTTTPQVITNTAVIAAPGYRTISRTATVTVALAPGQPDLTPSYKAVSPQRAGYGEHVTYTIVIHNATGPLTDTAILPRPTGCQQLLQAGGFEGNPETVFAHWHAGEPLAYKHQSSYFYDGSMSMRLHASMGSYPDCQAYHPYLWQVVRIPDKVYTTTTMIVRGQRLVTGSESPCSNADSAEADDILYLQMRNSGGSDLGDAKEIVNGDVVGQTWAAFEEDVTKAVDLYNRAGQEVQVYFNAAHDEDYDDTWFYLDALECEVCTEWLIRLTDTVPDGLSYVSGTLTATAGTVADIAAPTLRWSGVLSPTPTVTVTYAVTVSTTTPQVITNTAVIVAPGYQTISRTATVYATPRRLFLPVVMRDCFAHTRLPMPPAWYF